MASRKEFTPPMATVNRMRKPMLKSDVPLTDSMSRSRSEALSRFSGC